jgi:predicted membrane-bound spermidine synthase
MRPDTTVEANRLNTQVLVRYYEQEWEKINR